MGIKGPSLMELRLNYYLLRVDKRHVFTLVLKKKCDLPSFIQADK